MNARPSSREFKPDRIDFQTFGLFVAARRVHRRATHGRIAREAGLTVDRVRCAEAQRNPGEKAFFALCKWMGEAPEIFMPEER